MCLRGIQKTHLKGERLCFAMMIPLICACRSSDIYFHVQFIRSKKNTEHFDHKQQCYSSEYLFRLGVSLLLLCIDSLHARQLKSFCNFNLNCLHLFPRTARSRWSSMLNQIVDPLKFQLNLTLDYTGFIRSWWLMIEMRWTVKSVNSIHVIKIPKLPNLIAQFRLSLNTHELFEHYDKSFLVLTLRLLSYLIDDLCVRAADNTTDNNTAFGNCK